jgi:hypothetical protein
MDQELMDFDQWVELQKNLEIRYYAGYNDEGMILGVGPEQGIMHHPSRIEIDAEVAVAILDGKENMFSYRVDIPSKTLIKINKFITHSVVKIDDVLHRVVDKQWSDITDPDITISQSDRLLNFALNEKHKKLIWEGETEMIFLLTEYNDPNILLSMINVRVSDLIDSNKEYTVDHLPTKFSIYTRRIFDKYIYENN